MTTAVDTNALLALLYDGEYAAASEAALRRAYRAGKVVIAPIAYAELAADGHFESRADLDEFLRDLSIALDQPSREALFVAGTQFQAYTDRRPSGLQCPMCGTEQSVRCANCSGEFASRQHIAADFVIGGHAMVDGDALVTFDRAFYRSYFPSLTVADS